MDKDKIKHKIKALLSKTIENGATKEEMESALNKANKLMIDFFISENDIKDIEVIEKCVLKQFEIIKTGFNFSIFYDDLAKLFDCEYYYTTKYISFFGYDYDVDLCGYFYTMISRICLSEKDKYTKTEEYLELKKYYHGKKISSNFINGFLWEVITKLRDLYKEKESNIPISYSLMVIDKKNKVENEFNNLNIKIRKKYNSIRITEETAFIHGVTEGKKVDLIQGINSGSNMKELSNEKS